jgi:hypothetical protein
MKLNGQISGFELIDILQMLSLAKKSGLVLLQNSQEWLMLIISEGKLTKIFAPSFTINFIPEIYGIADKNSLATDLTDYSLRQLDCLLIDSTIDMLEDNLAEITIAESAQAIAQKLIVKALSWLDGEFKFYSDFSINDNRQDEIAEFEFDVPLEIPDLLLMAVHEIDQSNLYMVNHCENHLVEVIGQPDCRN